MPRADEPTPEEDYPIEYTGGYMVGEARGGASYDLSDSDWEEIKERERRRKKSGFVIGFQLPSPQRKKRAR